MDKNKSQKNELPKEKIEKVLKVKKPKKKIKKNITTGIAFVNATFNNTIVSIADSNGNVILESNQGIKATGNKIDFNAKNESILIEGKQSYLENKTILATNSKISKEMIEVLK